MNVASLELCKELYELSGWEPNTEQWQRIDDSDPFPAYDLGYLLRKLPPKTSLVRTGLYSDHWTIWLELREDTKQSADNPEDAACKLAIELFKQGVIARGAGDATTN